MNTEIIINRTIIDHETILTKLATTIKALTVSSLLVILATFSILYESSIFSRLLYELLLIVV